MSVPIMYGPVNYAACKAPVCLLPGFHIAPIPIPGRRLIPARGYTSIVTPTIVSSILLVGLYCSRPHRPVP